MAPLATAFVLVLPNMSAFPAAAAAGIRGANMGAAGAAQGAAFGTSFAKSASKLMAAGVVVGLGVLLKDSVQAAGNFEAAMVRLVTSAGETGTLVSGNLKIVAQGILDMAGPVGTTVEALGKAMYTVESGSFHGAEALKVLRAAAEGAKAEQSDLTKVTNAVTTALVDYHLKGDDAAFVTTKLVAATAAGKTTFEQLTGALHSVLPAASAAGISLEDILGSLASMTLHGVSAEQATQNLADVIRHMQNPTNVQAKELALLGLTTNRLADDLRTKGLSGTLQMISDRIKNLMPPGSQQVILQLQGALSKLSPEVQELGMKLLQGSISYIEYRKAARDLTPIQASQAMSFATLAGATHRIGDEQLSGAQTMQAYAQALAKATGDATGMNVALMLTGANAEQTNNAIKMVSDASTEAGNHVKGWGEIQETFNFKLGAMKSSLGVAAVAIGEGLLPVIGKLFEGITAVLGPMADWITHHQTLTTIITASLAAFLALGTTVVIILKIGAALKILAGALRLAAIAEWLFLSPWGLIVLAIAAVVGALVYAYFHFDGFRKVADTVFRAVMVVIKLWWEYAKFVFGLLKDVIMNVVVPAVMWLWHNAIEPAFKAFLVAVRVWWEYAKVVFNFLRAVIMDVVVPAVLWLWHNAIEPAFNAIVVVIKAWWEYAKFAFGLFKGAIDVIGAVVSWLYDNVFHPVFTAISFLVQAWWVIIQVVFAALKLLIMDVIGPVIMWLWHTIFEPVFNAIGSLIGVWWSAVKAVFGAVVDFVRDVLGPIFTWLWHTILEPVWHGIRDLISGVWNNGIKPVFSAIADFVTKTIPDAFRSGVDLVGKIWDGLKGIVSAPINAVIRFVINDGIIKAWNTVAGWVGVKDRIPNVPEIKLADGGSVSGAARGFAAGGQITGFGGPRQDNIPIMASAGEYVIPAHVVSDIGPGWFDSLIGKKPMRAGDGSSGIAIGRFADGGLIGAILDPAGWVGDRVNGLIDKIPGTGIVRDIGVAASHKLIAGLVEWVKSKVAGLFGADASALTVLPGGLVPWLYAQHGKPYGWAQAGPGSYDCSGIVSAVWNILHGQNPYRHTFSTGNQAPFFPKVGQWGLLTAGWANPGERGGGSVGHTAAKVGGPLGIGVESTGSRGVRIGVGTTNPTSFAHWGTFDRGGPWPNNTAGVNTSGRTEHVFTGDAMHELITEIQALRRDVQSVAPGVGVELNGAASTMRHLARTR